MGGPGPPRARGTWSAKTTTREPEQNRWWVWAGARGEGRGTVSGGQPRPVPGFSPTEIRAEPTGEPTGASRPYSQPERPWEKGPTCRGQSTWRDLRSHSLTHRTVRAHLGQPTEAR